MFGLVRFSLQTTVSHAVVLTVAVVSLIGLSVWPASILLSQWVAKLARDNSLPDMHDKMVLELGAGCGLPAIVAGEY
jgi:predicted nicotinamide N-methyase